MVFLEVTEEDESVVENTVVVDSPLSLLLVVVTKVNTAGVDTFCKAVGSVPVSERIVWLHKNKK